MVSPGREVIPRGVALPFFILPSLRTFKFDFSNEKGQPQCHAVLVMAITCRTMFGFSVPTKVN